MTLIKNEVPILEYDTETAAVIMPGHSCNFMFPQKAVLLFMDKEIEDYVSKHDCEVVGNFESITKKFYVYETVHKGIKLVLCQAPLGGAGAVQIMDQLIVGGASEIIAAGCCGALLDGVEGEFFVPTAALRQEGTSYHYLPPSREVELDAKAILAIEKALDQAGFPFLKCKTWTTDGFYRETKDMVQYRKEEGYSVVEMECASLAACAKMRGITFGQLLFTADSLANTEVHDTRNWGKDTFAVALKLAMDAVCEIYTDER